MTAAVASMDRPRAPRWMAIALLTSLALNLLFIGATASFLWRHGVERQAAPHLAPNILSYTSTLPAERRKELENRTEEGWRSVRPFRRALREAREESMKALTAEPFDQQRYQAAQSRLLAADQKAREAIYKFYGEIAVILTPEERSGFLRWREKRRPMQNLLDAPDKQAADPKQH